MLTHRRTIGVHYWLTGNPYSEMLYRQFRGKALPERMTMLEELAMFTSLPARDRLLWVHSEASYSWGKSGRELEAAYSSYLRSLKRWHGKLVWTIHDDGLHLNDPNPARIQAIRALLRANVDLVHVHSEAAAAVVADRFGIGRERIVVVPHPSYAPLYQVDSTRGAGQRDLLSFGNLKHYKNYDALAAALQPGSFRLTIAGSGDLELPKFPIETEVRRRFIPDSEVAELFNRSHFLVLPYTESLTSGAAALSMGFGVPIIAPDLGGMREAVPKANWPLIYPAQAPDGLAKALQMAQAMSSEDYSKLHGECLRFGSMIHPDDISRELLKILFDRRLIPARLKRYS